MKNRKAINFSSILNVLYGYCFVNFTISFGYLIFTWMSIDYKIPEWPIIVIAIISFYLIRDKQKNNLDSYFLVFVGGLLSYERVFSGWVYFHIVKESILFYLLIYGCCLLSVLFVILKMNNKNAD